MLLKLTSAIETIVGSTLTVLFEAIFEFVGDIILSAIGSVVGL